MLKKSEDLSLPHLHKFSQQLRNVQSLFTWDFTCEKAFVVFKFHLDWIIISHVKSNCTHEPWISLVKSMLNSNFFCENCVLHIWNGHFHVWNVPIRQKISHVKWWRFEKCVLFYNSIYCSDSTEESIWKILLFLHCCWQEQNCVDFVFSWILTFSDNFS